MCFLMKTRWLICNMTYLRHHLTSHDLDPCMVKFGLDLLRSTPYAKNAKNPMHMLWRVSTIETLWCLNYVTSLHSSKVVGKKTLLPIKAILTFLELYRLTRSSKANSDGILAKDRFKSYLVFFRGFLHISNSFRDNGTFAKKYRIWTLNLAFDDLFVCFLLD